MDLREFSKTKLTTAPYSIQVSKGKKSVSLLAGKKAWPKQYVSKVSKNKPKSPATTAAYSMPNYFNPPGNHFLANPWSVENLEHFLYYCCPECKERIQ